MAIDRTGISSLDTGASDITYSGNQGPKSPDQQLMASADPMLVEEYNKYVFEMEEQGLQPISFREFVEQIMAESRMAKGGIARLGLWNGGNPQRAEGRQSSGMDFSGATNIGGTSGPVQASSAPIGGHHGQGGADVMPVHQPPHQPEAIAEQWKRTAEQLKRPEGTERALEEFEALKEPPLPPMGGGGGEGSGPTGPTPAEIEAMRIKLLLLQQEADKTAADEKVATIKQQEEEDAFLDSLKREYDFEDLEYGDDRGLMYMAHGGRVPSAYGGIIGND